MRARVRRASRRLRCQSGWLRESSSRYPTAAVEGKGRQKFPPQQPHTLSPLPFAIARAKSPVKFLEQLVTAAPILPTRAWPWARTDRLFRSHPLDTSPSPSLQRLPPRAQSFPTLPGSCTPTSTANSVGPGKRFSSVAWRGRTSAAMPCGVRVSATPANNLSEVRNKGTSGDNTGFMLARCRAPDSLTSSASTGSPDPSAASTNRTPSTAAIPPSPRSPASAARNRFSQRLSRLAIRESFSLLISRAFVRTGCAMHTSLTNPLGTVKQR